jgi:MFS family permease
MTIRTHTEQMRSNVRHLYADIFWFGVLSGSTLAFQAVYAARLGASSLEISLLTAGPAFFNLLFSLPTGVWLQGRSLIRATFWSSLVMRAGYFLLILLPWLWVDQLQIWGMIWITFLISIPGTIYAIGFNAMFAGVIPAEERADVIGRRNATFAISLIVTTLLCGLILDRVSFPLNYQIVFFIGALGAILSTHHLGQIRPLTSLPAPEPNKLSVESIENTQENRLPDESRLNIPAWRSVLRLDLLRTSFGLFMIAYWLLYSFQYVPLVLFPLVLVRMLNLTDGQISLGTSIFYVIMFLTSLQIGRLSARFGHRLLLVYSGFTFVLYPLVMGLARDVTLYLVASIMGGIIWGVLNASLLNRLMERTPENERPACMALHNLALNLGILTGSLIAPWLADAVGLRSAMFVGAALRLVAAILIDRWG